MKPKKINTQHRTSVLLVIGLLFSIPFILGSGCTTDADPEETEALANTTWRLEYIQAEEGNVFPDHESSRWEPEMGNYAYYLEFIGEDTITTAPDELRNSCTVAYGNYSVILDDSIHINWTGGRIPRGPHCSRMAEFPAMVANSFNFLRKEDALQLNVNSYIATQPSEIGWAKSVLYFSRVTKNED